MRQLIFIFMIISGFSLSAHLHDTVKEFEKTYGTTNIIAGNVRMYKNVGGYSQIAILLNDEYIIHWILYQKKKFTEEDIKKILKENSPKNFSFHKKMNENGFTIYLLINDKTKEIKKTPYGAIMAYFKEDLGVVVCTQRGQKAWEKIKQEHGE